MQVCNVAREWIDMFIAMNRFRVAKGSEAAFEHAWMSRGSHLDKVPSLWSFTFSGGPRLRITHSVLLTRCGKTVRLAAYKRFTKHVNGLKTTFPKWPETNPC
jgi:hypothetical protein